MLVGSKVDYDISNLYIPKDGKGDNDYQKSFNATLTIIVRDKDGKVIKKYKQKSHSPTVNFIGLMMPLTWFNATGYVWNIANTSNSIFSYKPTITISEVGIILNLITEAASSYSPSTSTVVGNTLVWYDVLSSPISVGNGQNVVIYYTFSVNA